MFIFFIFATNFPKKKNLMKTKKSTNLLLSRSFPTRWLNEWHPSVAIRRKRMALMEEWCDIMENRIECWANVWLSLSQPNVCAQSATFHATDENNSILWHFTATVMRRHRCNSSYLIFIFHNVHICAQFNLQTVNETLHSYDDVKWCVLCWIITSTSTLIYDFTSFRASFHFSIHQELESRAGVCRVN